MSGGGPVEEGQELSFFKKFGGEWNYKKVCFIFWFVLFWRENV